MWRDGWKTIAELGGADKDAHAHFEELLRANGIPNAIEGSKIYHVFVPDHLAQEAIALLHAGAQGGNYCIRIVRSIDSDTFVHYGPGATPPS